MNPQTKSIIVIVANWLVTLLTGYMIGEIVSTRRFRRVIKTLQEQVNVALASVKHPEKGTLIRSRVRFPENMHKRDLPN
jgi:hypothetical protein